MHSLVNWFSTQKQTELALHEELDMGCSSLSRASREVTELSVPLAMNSPHSRPIPHQQAATTVGSGLAGLVFELSTSLGER